MKAKVLLMMFVMLGLIACHDDKDPEPVPTPDTVKLPDIPDWEEPDYAFVKSNTPVYVSEGIRPEVKKGMEQFLTNITTMDDARVVVLKPEEIGSFEGELMEAFNRGALIVLAHPTGKYFQEFAEKYGIFDIMPFDASQPVLLFATDNTKVGYTLYANGPAEGEDEAAYYKQRIFHFFRWLKQYRQNNAAATTRATTLLDVRQGRVASDEGQHIIQNFEVQMSHDLLKGNGSKPQNLKTTGSFDVSYHIYPVYAFEDSGAEAGDSYIVESEITAHNEEFYRPYVTDDPLNKYLLAGYFMEQLEQYAQLVGEDGADLSDIAIESDSPQSEENLKVEQSHYAKGVVCNRYQVENINFKGTPTSMDFLNEAIPQIARDEFTTRAFWSWMVPAGTNGVSDCAKIHFNVKSLLNLQYGSFYYKVLGASEQAGWQYRVIGSTVSITPPERRPQEVIDRENRQLLLTFPLINTYESGGDPFGITPADPEDTIGANWDVGDKIYVEYSDQDRNHMKTTAEVVAVNEETGEASVFLELERLPYEGHLVAFYYPYSYLVECLDGSSEKTLLKSQKGTWEDFAENWEAMLGFDHPKIIDGKVTLPNGIAMEYQRAQWFMKFFNGTRDITPEVTKLEIRCDTGKGRVYTYEINPEESLPVFLVTVNPDNLASITVSAYTPEGVFTISQPSVVLEAGKLYVSANLPLSEPSEGGPVNLAYKVLYEAQDGDVLTGQARPDTHITIADGATITLRDAYITGLDDNEAYAGAGITCLGDATIIIEGENEVVAAHEVYPAIHVPVDKTLTFKGDGELKASSRGGGYFSYAAAIGAGYGIPCGNIVVEGGTIEAIANGEGGAGIGAAMNSASCGYITITGGSVTAKGGSRAAGIGNGMNSSSGDVTITGGEVNAIGGLGAAGIGAYFGTSFGDITITGGKVRAEGGDSSPGIGYRGYGGTILITGGEVEAIGNGSAAAIGGSSGLADSPCIFEGITITDGVTKLVLTKGEECPRYIGQGKVYYECGPVVLDGIENPTHHDRYPHFASITEGVVWILLNHNR